MSRNKYRLKNELYIYINSRFPRYFVILCSFYLFIFFFFHFAYHSINMARNQHGGHGKTIIPIEHGISIGRYSFSKLDRYRTIWKNSCAKIRVFVYYFENVSISGMKKWKKLGFHRFYKLCNNSSFSLRVMILIFERKRPRFKHFYIWY